MTASNIIAGLGVGGFTTGAVVLAEVVVSGSTRVPLEVACGVGGFACGLVWWLGRKFQSIDDKFAVLDKKVSGLSCVRDKERNECEFKS